MIGDRGATGWINVAIGWFGSTGQLFGGGLRISVVGFRACTLFFLAYMVQLDYLEVGLHT
jgi:hypothetical protein